MISYDRRNTKIGDTHTSKIKCFRCNKYGHITKNCRNHSDTRQNGKGFDRKCFRCNKIGHIGRDCPRYGDGANASRKESANARSSSNSTSGSTVQTTHTAKLAALITTCPRIVQGNEDEISFVIDSGATSHMVNQPNILTNEVKTNDTVGITVAKKNVELRQESVGELAVKNMYGEEFKMNVVYVPDLVANLLSVRVLRKNGYDVVFGENVEIINRLTGVLVARAEEDIDGLFVVRFCLLSRK